MPTTRDDLERSLAIQDADALRLILEASEVDTRGAQTAPELAARIADAIWWNYCTPLGYVVERSSFEDVVRHVARRLKVADRVDPDLPVWDQVDALTRALVAEIPDEGISLSALDDTTRGRLSFSWLPPVSSLPRTAGAVVGEACRPPLCNLWTPARWRRFAPSRTRCAARPKSGRGWIARFPSRTPTDSSTRSNRRRRHWHGRRRPSPNGRALCPRS